MAAWDIDEKKLASALPPPTSSTSDDIKWSSAVFGLGLFWLAVIAFIIVSVLHALF